MNLDDGASGGGDEQYGGVGQTRTRLPERGGDVYGGARRGRSSSRSLVTVVGVVVLLIAAIAFANRGGGDSSSDSGDNKPNTSATAASGTRPVKSKSAGIPSGFAHDQQGAASAAANYAVVLVSADILKPAQRGEILQQVFVPNQVPTLADKFNKTYNKDFLNNIGLDESGNPTAGHTYISRTMPIGTKTTKYSDTTATVEVWCTGVFGTTGEESTNPVSNDYFTMTFAMRWSSGDWKVASFSQKEGPAPVNGDNKVSTSQEISQAVEEFGGFTYAR